MAAIGEHHGGTSPAATYGLVCLGSAVAFTILTRAIIRADGSASLVAQAVGRDAKGRASMALYAATTGLAFVNPWISYALFAAVAVMWLAPDRLAAALAGARAAVPDGHREHLADAALPARCRAGLRAC